MTPKLTRRGAIELLAAGLLAGGAAPVVAASNLAPPKTPMLFRHTVRREMVGGAAITTERVYEIRFLAAAHGYRIEGGEIASSIDAPPEMERLSEIWRKTPQPSPFPFDLDAGGLVLSGTGPQAGPVADLGEAIDAGLGMLRGSGKNETELADAQAFFLWLQQAANQIGSELPRDLFVPTPLGEQASRTIELPGGGSGSIETRFWGQIAAGTGLMQEAVREIVTRTGNTSRRTVESWFLG